jgi:hypothetical protein
MAGGRVALQRSFQAVAGTSAEPSFLGMLGIYRKMRIPDRLADTYTRTFAHEERLHDARPASGCTFYFLWGFAEAFQPTCLSILS